MQNIKFWNFRAGGRSSFGGRSGSRYYTHDHYLQLWNIYWKEVHILRENHYLSLREWRYYFNISFDNHHLFEMSLLQVFRRIYHEDADVDHWHCLGWLPGRCCCCCCYGLPGGELVAQITKKYCTAMCYQVGQLFDRIWTLAKFANKTVEL